MAKVENSKSLIFSSLVGNSEVINVRGGFRGGPRGPRPPLCLGLGFSGTMS